MTTLQFQKPGRKENSIPAEQIKLELIRVTEPKIHKQCHSKVSSCQRRLFVVFLWKVSVINLKWLELTKALFHDKVATTDTVDTTSNHSYGGQKGSQYVYNTNHARVTTTAGVLMGQHVNLNINVSGALETTLLGPAKRGKDYQLYSFGYSPIFVNNVEKSLQFYPSKSTAKELVYGLQIGLKLQYYGPLLPVQANN
ncbi:unnamed protein product [Mytilus coruscus]|uniref:Uncharacterized protein n=1 Tax=Mytilus coruscus TaxID=42192 RepID=A0A6J8B5F3_MYTCO|nr:unnamed protein product [Mytilus coruscus]